MKEQKDLSDIRNYLYGKAENLWWISLWIAIGTQFLSLIAVWTDKRLFLTIIGFMAIASPLVITWLREIATEITNKADKCRRVILYADGLGQEIPKHELATICAWVMGATIKEAPFVSPYYSSSLKAGPNRLADIMAEAAFFTYQLVERLSFLLNLFFGLSIMIVIGILYTSNLFVDDDWQQGGLLSTVAKSAALVIAFLISGDFRLLIKKFYNLRTTSKETFEKCVKMRDDEDLKAKEILQAVEDYNIALVQSPPIPGRFYRKYKEELNRVYRESHN